MADLTTRQSAAVNSLSLTLFALTGEKPQIVEHPDHVQVNFTERQKILMSDWLEKRLKAEPGPVRINAQPIVVDAVKKAYGGIILAGLGSIFMIGYLMGMRE